MNTSQLVKLENNTKFRRRITSEGIWKNYAFVPPSIIIFVSVFGLLYLLNNDLLMSKYAIPFVVVFLISTLWFKFVRKYLIDKKIANQDCFQICFATPLLDKEDNSFVLFVTNNHRHDKNYLEKQSNRILSNDEIKTEVLGIDIQRLTACKSSVFESGDNLFVTKMKKKKKEKDFFIIYTTSKALTFVENATLLKFR